MPLARPLAVRRGDSSLRRGCGSDDAGTRGGRTDSYCRKGRPRWRQLDWDEGCMGDVFISFSTVDRQQAMALAEALECHGFSVWWEAKRSGSKTYDDPSQALDDAKAVIVIWSQSSVRSPWVVEEARRAQAQGKLIATKAAGLRAADLPLDFRALPTEAVEDGDRILHEVEGLAGPPSRSGIATEDEERTEVRGHGSGMDWPISAETFRFVIVIAALVMGWYDIAPALLVAGIVGAFVGAAMLEGTGWDLDVPRTA